MGGIPSARVTTTGSFIERVDRVTPVVVPGSGARPVVVCDGVRAILGVRRALALGARSADLRRESRRERTSRSRGLYSKYLGAKGDYLNETTSSVSFSESRGAPYLNLPGGQTRADFFRTAGWDRCAGRAVVRRQRRAGERHEALELEVVNQTNFLINGLETMPFRIYLQSLLIGFSQSLAANRLGTFTYPSLSAITAGSPSSFSRSLNVPSPSGGEWIGAGSAGGSWKKGTFTLMGGARVDANVFTSAPQENPQSPRRSA